MIKVGIIGGSGYTAGELLRILVHHPYASIDFVFSTTNAGKPIISQHVDLIGDIDMSFTDKINPNVDVLFLCLGHGRSRSFLEENKVSENTKIIDLGNDFRLAKEATFENRNFIYGLPELNKKDIIEADNIANPGCFATAIQLALLPLAKENMLNDTDTYVPAVPWTDDEANYLYEENENKTDLHYFTYNFGHSYSLDVIWNTC